MRVLLATDWTAPPGGTERYFSLLAETLAAHGDDVALLTSDAGGGPASASFVARSSEWLPAKALLQVANPSAARTTRRALARFRPDVAYVGMFEMHLSPSLLSSLAGLPYVLSVGYYKPVCPNGLRLRPDGSICTTAAGRGCVGAGCVGRLQWPREALRYRRIGAAVARAAAVVTCSPLMERELGRAGVAATGLPWPVAVPSRAERAPARTPLFLYAGRLAREKGVPLLLRALARARRESPSLRLRIVGDGPERPLVEALVERLGLRQAVDLRPWLAGPELEAAFADAWALVLPSLWAEPLGLVAVEALARGVPVIGSQRSGFAETLAPGCASWFFPNADEQALAAALARMAAAGRPPSVPDQLVRRVRELHDPDAHVRSLHPILEAAAAGRR